MVVLRLNAVTDCVKVKVIAAALTRLDMLAKSRCLSVVMKLSISLSSAVCRSMLGGTKRRPVLAHSTV